MWENGFSGSSTEYLKLVYYTEMDLVCTKSNWAQTNPLSIYNHKQWRKHLHPYMTKWQGSAFIDNSHLLNTYPKQWLCNHSLVTVTKHSLSSLGSLYIVSYVCGCSKNYTIKLYYQEFKELCLFLVFQNPKRQEQKH